MRAAMERGLAAQLMALIVFTAALWLQTPQGYGGVYDDGLSLVIAKAIARGDGFHFIHLPGAPPATFFPPLFPALVGGIGIIFPDFPANLLLVEIANAAMLAVAAWLAFGLLRSMQLSGIVACAAVALAFLNAPALSTTVRRVPEALLLVWWFGALVAVPRIERQRAWALGAGAMAGAAVLTAHVGIVVLLGVIGGLVVRRWWRAAAVAAGVAALLVGPWLLWSLVNGVDPTAADSVAAALSQVGPSWQDAVRLIRPTGGGPIVVVAAVAVYLAAAVGMWRAWSAAPEWVLVVAAYMGAVLILPGTQRSVGVLMPSVIGLAVIGGVWIWNAHPGLRRPFAGAATIIVVPIVVFNARALLERQPIVRVAPDVEEASRLFITGVGAETPDTAVVATDAGPLLYLYTNRRTVPLTPTSSSGGSDTSYCAKGADYVALSGLDSAPGDSLLLPRSEKIFAVTEGPSLYRLQCEP